MPLEEHQIRRYARQILLPEVGGRGQQALLDHGAAFPGDGGMADSVALAYLAAGGSPVRVPPGRRASGFLFDMAGAIDSVLQDFNPDAARDPPAMGLLAELPAQLGGPAPWVVMGWTSSGRGGLLYRTAGGCAACFSETAARHFDSPRPSPAASVALGALGALAFQRCTLGLSDPLGGLWLEASGAVTRLQPARCEQHR